MKKYLLGLFAITLAIGFSAFTLPKHSTSKDQLFYWYPVKTDLSNQIDHTAPLFSGAQESQAFADSNPTCTAGNNADCSRGFIDQQTSDVTVTGDATPERKQ